MERKLLMALTLLASGRAMTLAYIHRAGAGGPGDPPAAWLMPLIGDAAIGLTALLVAYFIWTKRGLWVWTLIVVWNALAIFDALSALIISTTNPWPEFFMLRAFGITMFIAASAMHGVALALTCGRALRGHFLEGRCSAA